LDYVSLSRGSIIRRFVILFERDFINRFQPTPHLHKNLALFILVGRKYTMKRSLAPKLGKTLPNI
jgi:hypothetical protein